MEIKNLYAYCKERFSFVTMMLFVILFFTVSSVANYTIDKTLSIRFNELIGSVAVISFFFRLRVFDEIKDYALDMVNHPHRILQSGRIKLKQLIILSVIGGIVEIAWCTANGLQTTMTWGGAFVFALLMRYEFFIPSFLKKHLFIYAFSHMLIMPLIITWIWSAYAVISFHTSLVLLSSLSLLSGFAFEIARKIHIPEKEKPLIASYSKIVGYKGAIILVLLILLGGIATQFLLLRNIHSSIWPFLLIGLLYLFILGFYVSSLLHPIERTINQCEVLVSLFMVFSYSSIILEIVLA
jgi:UbiA prenyltransferase family